VIAANADVLAGVPLCAALAKDDVAWDDVLVCDQGLVGVGVGAGKIEF